MLPYYDDHCLVSNVYHPVSPSFPDPTLTFTNVTRVLESMKDVDSLVDVLNVPDSVEYKISQDYATPEQQRNAIVRYWLQSMPNASWSGLAGGLYIMEEMTTLEAVKQYFHNPTGMLS